MHRLETEVWIPRPRDEVFPFFAAAENLEKITPPFLRFEITTPGPLVMREGLLIDYRLRLHGIPQRWRTRIARWDPPHAFVDEQLRGPYHTWHHQHTFQAVEGGTLMRDQVDYRLPLEPLGLIVHPLIRFQLRRIFQYRGEVISRLICPGQAASVRYGPIRFVPKAIGVRGTKS